MRERLLGFLRERFPESLPRTRVEAVTAPLSVPPDWAVLDPYGDSERPARAPGQELDQDPAADRGRPE